jgi:hypothetical protein
MQPGRDVPCSHAGVLLVLGHDPYRKDGPPGFSSLVMRSTDELEVREVEEQLGTRLRGHDVMDLETASTLAALIAAAAVLPGTHHASQLLPGARRVGAMVRLVQRALSVAFSLTTETAAVLDLLR